MATTIRLVQKQLWLLPLLFMSKTVNTFAPTQCFYPVSHSSFHPLCSSQIFKFPVKLFCSTTPIQFLVSNPHSGISPCCLLCSLINLIWLPITPLSPGLSFQIPLSFTYCLFYLFFKSMFLRIQIQALFSSFFVSLSFNHTVIQFIEPSSNKRMQFL